MSTTFVVAAWMTWLACPAIAADPSTPDGTPDPSKPGDATKPPKPSPGTKPDVTDGGDPTAAPTTPTKPARPPKPDIKPPKPTDGQPTPLVLDLGGSGQIRFGHPVHFDIYGTGDQIKVSWPTADFGFLALDLNGNGIIDSGVELFGDATALLAEPGTTAENGFAALAQYDENHDGVIDARDPIFSRLRIWVDRNGDGICQPSEVQPLSAYNITSLNLGYRHATAHSADGRETALLIGTYRFSAKDHRPQTGRLADIYLQIGQD